MQEIKCPRCGTVFQVEEAGYAEILRQVRDKEFEKAIADRAREMEKTRGTELELAEEKTRRELADSLAEKDRAIAELQLRLEAARKESELAVKNIRAESELEAKTALADKDAQILRLNSEMESVKAGAELREKDLKESYELKLKDKDEQIGYYKDLKAKLSVKLLGETLEQHCENEFNKLRATGFRNAYFEKDNDASSGTKGDYIFRDRTDDGLTYISIMFEMKNEADVTATKHKNEHFFAKLDKDRNEKGCEYAVLVSLLEPESELYNTGIVDVSHRYPKMYVIRPQFFIPMITMLRNAAQSTIEYKTQLELVRKQDMDVARFEEEMERFKDAFGRNYRLASDKFHKAIEEIDKSIDHLQKIKDALTGAENNLRLANSKAEDLSIKKLTKNSPSVRAKFEQLEKDGE
ncbi:MAG: DUF2130 domain-containing protein [Firmicutes bacterium]|nr:DUF2130 domain-containing protein [Bacillota bacterium]